MARPRMIVVAGPPGSGKTRYFPVSAYGVDSFNIDDRCAQILGSKRGSREGDRKRARGPEGKRGLTVFPFSPSGELPPSPSGDPDHDPLSRSRSRSESLALLARFLIVAACSAASRPSP